MVPRPQRKVSSNWVNVGLGFVGWVEILKTGNDSGTFRNRDSIRYGYGFYGINWSMATCLPVFKPSLQCVHPAHHDNATLPGLLQSSSSYCCRLTSHPVALVASNSPGDPLGSETVKWFMWMPRFEQVSSHQHEQPMAKYLTRMSIHTVCLSTHVATFIA